MSLDSKLVSNWYLIKLETNLESNSIGH